MKDLVLKKKSELEEHRRRAHLIGEEGYSDEFNIEAIESGKFICRLLDILCLVRCAPCLQIIRQTTSSTFALYSTGAIDPALVLEQIEAHIATVKDEAFSRKDILEKVERFLNACEEEAWLEDYNKVWMMANLIFSCASHVCFLDNCCFLLFATNDFYLEYLG